MIDIIQKLAHSSSAGLRPVGVDGHRQERIATPPDGVQQVSEALDHLRGLCSEVGVATLFAEVQGVAPGLIVAALDEVSCATGRALETLLAAAVVRTSPGPDAVQAV